MSRLLENKKQDTGEQEAGQTALFLKILTLFLKPYTIFAVYTYISYLY
ncbi:MAG: hypothetical protein JWP44_194 [Mucilaginibacter sp.]|nr:hypothetical protein [Mucilaginibacter sp.]